MYGVIFALFFVVLMIQAHTHRERETVQHICKERKKVNNNGKEMSYITTQNRGGGGEVSGKIQIWLFQ